MSDESCPTQAEDTQPRQQRSGVAHHAGNADSQWLAVTSFPDYCRVGDKIIAFDTTASLDNPIDFSPNVIMAGYEVYRVNDLCKGTQGNAGKGLVSGTSGGSGHVKLLTGQESVKVNGKVLARHDGECLINCDANGVGGAKGYLCTNIENVSSTSANGGGPPSKAEQLQQQAEENLEQAKELREALNDTPNGKPLEDAQALKGQVEALAEATQQQEQAVIDAYRNGDLTDDEFTDMVASTNEAANSANELLPEAERQFLKANESLKKLAKGVGQFAAETFTPYGIWVDAKDTAALFSQGNYIAGTGMAILTAISLFPPARIVRKTAEGVDAVGDAARAANRADEVPNKGGAPDSTNQPSGSSGGSGEPGEGVQVAGQGNAGQDGGFNVEGSASKRRGRSGKQARLREMANDPKVSSADRGWLKNDARHIEYGNKSGLRLPRNGRKSPGRKAADKGYELAHPHNSPASQGNSYSGSKLKNHADHKVETRLHRGRY